VAVNRILVADDDLISRRVLETMLRLWKCDVVTAKDGVEAWEQLHHVDGPSVALLDWSMPRLDGVEVCRRIRALNLAVPRYLILVTARTAHEDVLEALGAGADEYVTKPYDPQELHARLQTGRRIVDLQQSLAERVRELEDALRHVKQLNGLLPICSYCKRIRDDSNYWQQVESYVSKHTGARFSHGICPDCWTNTVALEVERVTGNKIALVSASGGVDNQPSELRENCPTNPLPDHRRRDDGSHRDPGR
jgi:phosphoserine phosphatase RsbU/P